jgi:esterase/lipase superfamily enzyme
MKSLSVIALLVCGAACGPSVYYDSLPYQSEGGLAPSANGRFNPVVFYATNRQKSGSTSPDAYYSAAKSPVLAYGTCKLDIPRMHRIGGESFATPLAGLSYSRSDIVIPTTPAELPRNQFFANLSAAVTADRPNVLLFIHGYNNAFPSAVIRPGQLAFDLGGSIVPVAYSWPAEGKPELYIHDENQIDSAARHLASFLRDLQQELPSHARLHVLCHSMGSRVTVRALARAAGAAPATQPSGRSIENLVFAAPDIDALEFQQAMLDDGLAARARRVTLYVSELDRPLRLSQFLHGPDYPRAGQAGRGIVVLPGIDTIDVTLNDSSVMGHGYVAANRAVMSDLSQMLIHSTPAKRRNLYAAAKTFNGVSLPYYLLRP